MPINTNLWNKIRYTAFTPVYNLLASPFGKSRAVSIQQLAIQPGEKVLIVGAGTGLDLEYIPKHAIITATDITPAMLAQLKKRSERLHLTVSASVMDGQQLAFPDESFDKIILHLIVAVIPDPVACLREAERVLKPGGSIAVFDKFLPESATPGIVRKALNLVTNFLFSDINRKFEEILAATKLRVVQQTNAGFGGNYKIYILKK